VDVLARIEAGHAGDTAGRLGAAALVPVRRTRAWSRWPRVRAGSGVGDRGCLEPGTYSAQLKVSGESGVVWEKKITFGLLQPPAGADAPLTVNVARESVTLDVPPGVYEFAAVLEIGGAPVGGRRKFHVSAAPAAVSNCTVTVLGLGNTAEEWLRSHGVACRPWSDTGSEAPEVVLVGDLSTTGAVAEGVGAA